MTEREGRSISPEKSKWGDNDGGMASAPEPEKSNWSNNDGGM